MKQPVIIVGAGGHGRVVADALLAGGQRVLGFVDPDPSKQGQRFLDLAVLGDDSALDTYSPESIWLANGLGGVGAAADASARRVLQQRLEARGWRFVAARHPSATISPFARIGDGAQLLAVSVVQVGANIGTGAIVNTAAVVEHDTSIGDWAHVAPGALVCGEVMIGAQCHIGAGAVVRQGLRIGEHTVVGAGAVVVQDWTGGVIVGVSARRMEEKP